MLIKIVFAYPASYVRQRGRKTIHDDFTAETFVEIAEIGKNEATEAYRLRPSRDFKMLDDSDLQRRPRPRTIFEWQNSLYWPVLDKPEFRPLDVKRWAVELARHDGSHVDAHRQIGPRAMPDVFDLAGAIERRRWPGWRIESIPVRTIVRNDHDIALTRLHKKAADLLLIDDRLYRRGPEPAWIVESDIHPFSDLPHPPILDVVPSDHSGAASSSDPDYRLPFTHYEIFRADRKCDALALIRSRQGPHDHREYHRWTTTFDKSRRRPDSDVLTPMLLGLHDAVGRMVSWMTYMTRRANPTLTQGLDDHDVQQCGPDHLRRLAGLTALGRDASARMLSGWISEVLQRLDGVDTRQEPFGHLETILRGLRRASVRADLDIAAGLTPLTEADLEIDGPLAWLADTVPGKSRIPNHADSRQPDFIEAP